MTNEERVPATRKFVKRAPNYSDNEKRFIVDRILRSYPVILDKRLDNRTKQEKARAWELLAAEFNSQGVFVSRNPTTLRTCWENLKRLKKNDCVRSVLEPYFSPEKSSHGISLESEDRSEMIDLEEQQQNKDGYDDVTERKLTVEVKIDEDEAVIFIPNPNTSGENCKHNNNAKAELDNMDPLSEIAETDNVDTDNNLEKDNLGVSVPAPNEKEKEPTKAKNRAARRLCKIKKRPVNIRNIWMKKKIELFKTMRQQAEEYGKMLATQKIELFQTLKRNAEEEGKIKQLILEEQLKQERIKTIKLENLV